ncbi:hypothetical protein I3843_16G045700 [Carya illinoinensis]|nr:hypothetical protein I3760_16G044600 [Carya illinoinensis]KAG7941486.1 hypothetical protein I3843_16G045700 [Carya illinoinensis]
MMEEGLGLQKMMMKTFPSKALVFIIKLVFLALCLLVYATFFLLFIPRMQQYRLPGVPWAFGKGLELKVLPQETEPNISPKTKRNLSKIIEMPSFMIEMKGGMKIGMVNMDDLDVSEWSSHNFKTIPVKFERISEYFEWNDLFPKWIDEEKEIEVPTCPEVPMLDFRRDVFRLQVHLVAANLAMKRGKRDWNGRTKVVFLSKCRLMMELFRCDDLVRQEGDWWLFELEMGRLELKVSFPVGSCNLQSPQESKPEKDTTPGPQREAYATVLHSSETYVCGAITLAQSLLQTGTKRDLILLIDSSISAPRRDALVASGWNIISPLTDYDKIIFIDSDIIVLRNLDLLFRFPQMSAAGNDVSIFNSGIMVIEPSNCTFRVLMERREDIVSHNGGDQVNFLKNFWANNTAEIGMKNRLFGADPPQVYSIHYLGLKPWLCNRYYDRIWNVEYHRVYASDLAHRRWWTLHDAMDERLQHFCGLKKRRRIELDWDIKKAREMGLPDVHRLISI